jgi:N-acetylglucosamine-6-phosphate deacetylase
MEAIFVKTLLMNGKIITPFRIINNGAVLIENGKIANVFAELPQPAELPERCIDVGGRYISPGFIDMHVHGGGGCEVMDASVESVQTMCRAHARFGTTSILPTTVAAAWQDIYAAIDAVRLAQPDSTGAKILGIHLEGPYFSQTEKGAQSPDFIKDPIPEEYMAALDYWDGIKIMGVAPELPGALALGRELRRRGILASIAHSNANYEEVLLAVENGYTNITHFYSGCSIVHRKNAYRFAGVVESGYLIDELTVQVIADGKHLPASLLKLIYKVKGADRIALITDALSYAAMPSLQENRVYTQKNGVPVILEDGVMKLPDRSSFAGSVATTRDLVKNMVELAEVPLCQAVKMATHTPARILNIAARTGSISIGLDADIVVFDSEFSVQLTMVAGKIVYQNASDFR